MVFNGNLTLWRWWNVNLTSHLDLSSCLDWLPLLESAAVTAETRACWHTCGLCDCCLATALPEQEMERITKAAAPKPEVETETSEELLLPAPLWFIPPSVSSVSQFPGVVPKLRFSIWLKCGFFCFFLTTLFGVACLQTGSQNCPAWLTLGCLALLRRLLQRRRVRYHKKLL